MFKRVVFQNHVASRAAECGIAYSKTLSPVTILIQLARKAIVVNKRLLDYSPFITQQQQEGTPSDLLQKDIVVNPISGARSSDTQPVRCISRN
jgi:hypothetical protein